MVAREAEVLLGTPAILTLHQACSEVPALAQCSQLAISAKVIAASGVDLRFHVA